jgi:hypothetical protein
MFFKAHDPDKLRNWYRLHLGIECEKEGGAIFKWRTADDPNSERYTVWAPFSADTDYFAPSTKPFMVSRNFSPAIPAAGNRARVIVAQTDVVSQCVDERKVIALFFSKEFAGLSCTGSPGLKHPKKKKTLHARSFSKVDYVAIGMIFSASLAASQVPAHFS